jgi:anaerobic selenocysteine-containing dehydrogenase
MEISRRDFIKCSALLGSTLLMTQMAWSYELLKRAESGRLSYEEEDELLHAENILYSVCLQCNTGCGIKVKVLRRNGGAVALKIDGSPYSPFNLTTPLPYQISPREASTIDVPICPKGHAGIQTAYDPYRITKVLKRAGKRGENKWMTISFKQAIEEIVNGGYLFRHVRGEENRYVQGLKDLYALRDSTLSKEMAQAVQKIWKEKDKKKAVEEFKQKFRDHLHLLIDPDHPDLGPKNNQVVYMWGRKKGGRSDFALRFFSDYFGTVNTHGHTTVCQGSLYFACKAMSEQYEFNRFTGGKKFYWQPDYENVRYLLLCGSNLFDANYGPTNISSRLIPRIQRGEVKVTVVDPRFNKAASKAHRYVPILPGTDAAFFMALIQAIIKEKRYDERYLRSANRAAAKAQKEPTWTNATLLVKIEGDGPARFLRAREIGLKTPEKIKGRDGKEDLIEYLVCMSEGIPTPVDPNDENHPVFGDLIVDTEIRGIKVKSAFKILMDEAFARSMYEWAKICGVPEEVIEEIAKELTSYGKRACVDVHRGVAQHTNGFYNVFAAMTVNALLGNFDWRGGMVQASTYDYTGKKAVQPFPLAKMAPSKLARFGTSIIRHEVKYEETTLFEGYPAKRNFYPLSSDVYEEIIPSIGDAYPYSVKALFLYMGAPNYALPAGHKVTEILCDVEKLPLFVACDILVGPSSMYADYIFPDLSYLERWEFHGSHPNMPWKVQPVRQPVIAPLTETVEVFGEKMPCSFEALILALAEELEMKGFGKDGLGKGKDLKRPEDLYLRMVANVALDENPVPDASEEEIKLFVESRRHLPKEVFDLERWKEICGDHFAKVVYVLNRGGRFQSKEDVYDGELVKNRYGSLINIYQEKTAETRNAFTGKRNPGYPTYIPVMTFSQRTPREEGLEDEYPLHLLTQRDILMTKSRTIVDYWLLAIKPENEVIINPRDAARFGLKDGDRVRVVSATNPKGVWDLGNGVFKPIVGKLKVTETIMPGVITFTLGHGHWATGASDFMIDGVVIKGDPRRGTGIHANAAMWVDPYLKNTCMIDPVGGSVSFYDTKVRLERV